MNKGGEIRIERSDIIKHYTDVSAQYFHGQLGRRRFRRRRLNQPLVINMEKICDKINYIVCVHSGSLSHPFENPRAARLISGKLENRIFILSSISLFGEICL